MERKEPNILFIVIDACRAKNLSCYGYSRSTSPNIDSLAREGALFENAWSCVTVTDASLTSIFSGKYPISHGIIAHGGHVNKEQIQKLNKRGIKLLPEILKRKGYITLAVDWLGRWHTRGYDYYTGINKYSGEVTKPKVITLRSLVKPYFNKLPRSLKVLLERNIRKVLPGGISTAKNTTDIAINLIKKNKSKKFFLFLHYWDTHFPYDPPKQFWKEFYESKNEQEVTIEDIIEQIVVKEYRDYFKHHLKSYKDVNEVIAKYDGEIAFVDSEIGRLIGFLESSGLLDNTIIILTSDHGELLLEHGIYFSHAGINDEALHIPLIIRYPDKIPGEKRIKGFVQHVDIVPTLLDILGKEDISDFDGKTLAPLIYDKVKQLRSAVYFVSAGGAKMAVRTAEYKYISVLPEKSYRKIFKFEQGGTDEEELYDLKDDPSESRNVIRDQPTMAKKLREELFAWKKSLENKIEEKEKKKINEIVDELKL